jgi:hypothetical protein
MAASNLVADWPWKFVEAPTEVYNLWALCGTKAPFKWTSL